MDRVVGSFVLATAVAAMLPCPCAASVGVALHLGMVYSQARFEEPSAFGEDELDHEFREGLCAGLSASMPLPTSLPLSIESGASYQRRGGSSAWTVPEIGEDGSESGTRTNRIRWTLDYLTVPLLLRVDVLHSTLGPFVVVGPEFAFSLSASEEEPSFAGTNGTDTHDLGDRMSNPDVGLLVGAGCGFRVAQRAAFIRLTYSYGLRDVLEKADIGDPELKNRAFALVVGVELLK